MDTVRMRLFSGELNGLSCSASDISCTYLHGITKEKIYTKASPEFGELEG